MSWSQRLSGPRTLGPWSRRTAVLVPGSSLSTHPSLLGTNLPTARRSLGDGNARRHQQHPGSRPTIVALAASSAGEGASMLEDTQRELKELEAERDAAVATAESSARAAMKLTDLVALLENMALEKIKSGDEETAKQVLQEKSSAKEVLEKTSAKAQVNYALAAALAHKIGTKQKEILQLLQSVGPTSTSTAAPIASTASPRAPPSPRAAPPPPPQPETPSWAPAPPYTPQPTQPSWSGHGDTSWSSSSSSSSSSPGGDYSGAYGSGFAVPKWQQSLEEAKQRASEAQRNADRAGRAARLTAEESIAAARRRLKDNASESILSARSRIASERVGAESSIAEAQERLRAQDAEVLAYVQRIMARYRRGEYVAEDELEFAFQQLEKRFLM